MKKLILILVSLALVSIFLLGCKARNAQLEDNDWYLTFYGDTHNPMGLLQGTEISLLFNSDEGSINGSAGCNSYGTAYEINGNKIIVYEIASTEMYCISPEGVMDQEREFLSLLGDTQSFEVDDKTLTIICSGGQALFFATAD